MIRTLEQILTEQRNQGQPILPLILQYCDRITRLVFDTCCHLENEKKAVQSCLNDLHNGQTPQMDQDQPILTDERGLIMLRAVLHHLNDQRGATYRSWLAGVIDSVHEWD